MRLLLCLSLFFCFFYNGFSQTKPAYHVFDAKGKKVSYTKILQSISKADVLLFGEYHNNPICHWLQLVMTRDLKPMRNLTLGAEMFEADNQAALNAYLADQITAKGLDSLARLWSNYKTDYAPLVDFAKNQQLAFIATNIPRKHANLVFREGLEALEQLPEAEKQWIAPLPIEYDAELPGYKNMRTMMPGHGGDNLPKAQAIKDATMAHFILQNMQQGYLFIHYNGTYHSDNYEGIGWYLRRQRPELRIVTIATVLQDQVERLSPEHKGRADFILCIDTAMTTTY